MTIPECPFLLKGDRVCAEFVADKILVHLPQTANAQDQAGRFLVIGVGPGLPYDPRDPNSELAKPDVSVGDYILFQRQDAYLFQDSGRLPDRFFAIIRAGQILASWKDLTPPVDVVNAILQMK